MGLSLGNRPCGHEKKPPPVARGGLLLAAVPRYLLLMTLKS